MSETPQEPTQPTSSEPDVDQPSAAAQQPQPENQLPENPQPVYSQQTTQPQQQSAYQQPAYQQQAYPQPGYPVGGGQKSKVAAGLLGIFLGMFGIHNFYLGFTGKAIAQLLITVLSLGFLSWASWIWGLIEGILILTGSQNFRTDAKGVPLRD